VKILDHLVPAGVRPDSIVGGIVNGIALGSIGKKLAAVWRPQIKKRLTTHSCMSADLLCGALPQAIGSSRAAAISV
jgi:hypothetical protein